MQRRFELPACRFRCGFVEDEWCHAHIVGTTAALIGMGVAAAAGGVASSVIGSNAAKDAAQTQAEASDKALDFQKQAYNTAQSQIAPYLASGTNALGTLNKELPTLTAGFDPTKAGLPATFSYGAKDFTADPGYQFALSEGMKAIQTSAAAKGGLLSGGTAKDLAKFATGYADQNYNTAYQRALGTYQQNYSNLFNTYETNQGNEFNRLQALAGMGLSATGMANQAGQNYANNAGQYAIGAGNAQAAGQVGSANAIASGIGGATSSLTGAYNSYLQNQQYLQMLQSMNQSSYGHV